MEDTIKLDSIKLASGTEGEFGYFFIKPTTNTFLETGYQIKEYQYIQLDKKADSNIVINMPQIRGENGYYYGKIVKLIISLEVKLKVILRILG